MNKFLAVALLAFVATTVSSASTKEGGSANALEFNEESETGALLGKEVPWFSDFCIDSAKQLKSDAALRARMESSKVLRILFSGAGEITQDVLNVQRQTVAEMARKLENPDSKEQVDTVSETEIQQIIEKGKEAIQEKRSILGGIFPAAKATLDAMYSVANSALFTSLAKIRATLDSLDFYDSFVTACDTVDKYESTFQDAFNARKQEVIDEITASGDKQDLEKIEKITLPTLKCSTTKTVVNMGAFCSIIKKGKGYFYQILLIN